MINFYDQINDWSPSVCSIDCPTARAWPWPTAPAADDTTGAATAAFKINGAAIMAATPIPPTTVPATIIPVVVAEF